jgi:hypothetical protein
MKDVMAHILKIARYVKVLVEHYDSIHKDKEPAKK